ncbi:MAG: peptide deformylase, partial [Clostridia bacterium]|nr:peptide deformylase [Clostridia bacterium]
MSVIVEAYDRNGNKFRIKGEDLKARAFCHEIDHLDGVLFTQKVIRPYEGE